MDHTHRILRGADITVSEDHESCPLFGHPDDAPVGFPTELLRSGSRMDGYQIHAAILGHIDDLKAVDTVFVPP